MRSGVISDGARRASAVVVAKTHRGVRSATIVDWPAQSGYRQELIYSFGYFLFWTCANTSLTWHTRANTRVQTF